MNPTIGIVGSGIMGRGVAQRFAQNGYKVILLDLKHDILQEAMVELEKSIKLLGMFQKDLHIENILKNISLTTEYAQIDHVDFIVENVPERTELKEQVYKKLDVYCKDSCIYMANTSCIPITLIGSYTVRPDRVIGVHFMNPVPMKNFAEVIKGYHTSSDTLNAVNALLGLINIETEVVNDSPGFVSNRLSHLFMNEAANLVYEGVAQAQQIDNIFKKAFGHKMGPLETADLIGLDTVMESLQVLYDEYQDPKYSISPLLKEMVRAGLCGRKTKEGFYNYKIGKK